MAPATKKVMLKKGSSFSAIVGSVKGKVKRKRFVGPCEVEMTADQIKSFKDCLQTAPEVIIAEDPKPKSDPSKDNDKGKSGPEGGLPAK